MATILAHIRVKPGEERRFEAVARELHRATHERETAVLRYEYWRGAEEGTYYGLLSFTDNDGFLTHQTSDHHEAASPVIAGLVESVRLEWVDPVADASPLPSTRPTEVPPDAGELWRRYARWFAIEEAGWWLPLREAGADGG
jgi:quinol monooxygenase YgiN